MAGCPVEVTDAELDRHERAPGDALPGSVDLRSIPLMAAMRAAFCRAVIVQGNAMNTDTGMRQRDAVVNACAGQQGIIDPRCCTENS
ncbi:hypothetical protein [Stenotrophomonas sp. 24(2023)]|uniref:hypothetical protein n=1 Tax=Stenotrophomonas sp. 24(2023) TaxID=3068324 RepID=UPI0027DF0E75|nr:hypothetical protein [Stenotrophomonas sp. 24(2023)]WMJ71218.1 hypothetical protein Q9R17_09035 [Stenotrophomonas sp. 24(2023)]